MEKLSVAGAGDRHDADEYGYGQMPCSIRDRLDSVLIVYRLSQNEIRSCFYLFFQTVEGAIQIVDVRIEGGTDNKMAPFPERLAGKRDTGVELFDHADQVEGRNIED